MKKLEFTTLPKTIASQIAVYSIPSGAEAHESFRGVEFTYKGQTFRALATKSYGLPYRLTIARCLTPAEVRDLTSRNISGIYTQSVLVRDCPKGTTQPGANRELNQLWREALEAGVFEIAPYLPRRSDAASRLIARRPDCDSIWARIPEDTMNSAGLPTLELVSWLEAEAMKGEVK